MGKDIHSHLQWLEEELLEEQDPMPSLEEPDFELDDILAEFAEEPVMPKPSRNRAREYDRMAFGDEVLPESAAVLVEKRKKPPKTQKTEKSSKGVGGLVVVAVLEVIAIILVLLRWALWFL